MVNGNPWFCRIGIAIGICTLILIVSGAFITTSAAASVASPAPAAGSAHRSLAIGVAALTIGLAVWLQLNGARGWLRALAWVSLAVLAGDALLGLGTPPLPDAMGVFHALFAPLFLATIVAMSVFTSSGWSRGPDPVEAHGWASFLRSLAVVTPPAVLVQILAGAAYRHKVLTVMPHMAGAMVVSLLTLVVSVAVLQNYPAHRSLRPAATALISIVLAQVCLGIAAFLMPLLDAGESLAFQITTASHVGAGAMTLAASVVLAMQVRRNVRIG